MTRNSRPPLALRASVVAIQSALALLATSGFALSAEMDPAVAELVKPTNTIEAGVTYTDEPSFKFGEYNGLARKGWHPLVNFNIRGGSFYDDYTRGNVQRWAVFGSNLGLHNQNLGAQYSHQGSFRIGVEYDEIQRNQFDDYKSLWRGVGTSTLTLPPGYPAASARTGTAGLANWNNIQTPNLNATTAGGGPGVVIPAMVSTAEIGTLRRKIGLTGGLNVTDRWTVSMNARTERKTGTKLTGTSLGGFMGALLPEPIDSDTTIVETAARYASKVANFGVGYNVSIYRDNISSWSAQNPFSNNTMLNNLGVMASPPDNQMHQWTVDGSWRFTPTTKLTVAGAHSRMTQNELFAYQGNTGWSLPGNSANAKEVKSDFVARLTAKPMNDLDVNAAYKYERRDNRTPIGTYRVQQRADIPAVPTAANTFVNEPLDRTMHTYTLDGRYTIKRGQIVSAGFEHQRIERETDNLPGAAAVQVWPSGKATENSLKLGYSQAFTDAISGRIVYQHARRKAHDYEEPEPNPATASANATFFGEVPGFRQFFLNDRNRDKLRAAVEAEPVEGLLLQAGVDYINDRFPSEFGVKKTNSTAWNLDASYAVSEKLTFNGYLTLEDAKTNQELFALPVARGGGVPPVIPHSGATCAPYTSALGLPSDYLTDPCRNWSQTQADKIWTVGLGVKSSQFMGGKLTLTGDVVYSRARTNIDFTGGAYYNNGIGQNVYIPAQNMPTITSTMTDFRLGAAYALDKQSKLKFGWLHRRLRSSDPLFDLFGITSVQAYIGPGLTSPRYSVNAVSVSYIYSFR